MAQRRIVIVGTDTGVGKTWVTCELARALVAQGLRVVAIKPVETGVDFTGDVGGVAGEDGALLAATTGQGRPKQALRRFAAPLAPVLAAELEGKNIAFDELVRECEALGAGADVLLVESAGGLLSPITWEHTAINLCKALNAPALLVAADRLGAISQVRMALASLSHAGVPCVGGVLNALGGEDGSAAMNAPTLMRLGVGGIARSTQGMDEVVKWIVGDFARVC